MKRLLTYADPEVTEDLLLWDVDEKDWLYRQHGSVRFSTPHSEIAVYAATEGHTLHIYSNTPFREGSYFELRNGTVLTPDTLEPQRIALPPDSGERLLLHLITAHGPVTVMADPAIVQEVELHVGYGMRRILELVLLLETKADDTNVVVQLVRGLTSEETQHLLSDASLTQKLLHRLQLSEDLVKAFTPLDLSLQQKMELLQQAPNQPHRISTAAFREMVVRSDQTDFNPVEWIDFIARHVKPYDAEHAYLASAFEVPRETQKYLVRLLAENSHHSIKLPKSGKLPLYETVTNRHTDIAFEADELSLLLEVQSEEVLTESQKESYLDMFARMGVHHAVRKLSDAEQVLQQELDRVLSGTLVLDLRHTFDNTTSLFRNYNERALQYQNLSHPYNAWAGTENDTALEQTAKEIFGRVSPVFYDRTFWQGSTANRHGLLGMVTLREEMYALSDVDAQLAYLRSTLSELLYTKLANIERVRRNLREEPDYIWKLDVIVEETKRMANHFGLETLDALVDEKAQDVNDDVLLMIVLGVLSMLGGLLTFGSGTLAMAGYAMSVGAGLMDLGLTMEYQKERQPAADAGIRGDEFTRENPEAGWLYFALLGFAMDGFSIPQATWARRLSKHAIMDSEAAKARLLDEVRQAVHSKPRAPVTHGMDWVEAVAEGAVVFHRGVKAHPDYIKTLQKLHEEYPHLSYNFIREATQEVFTAKVSKLATEDLVSVTGAISVDAADLLQFEAIIHRKFRVRKLVKEHLGSVEMSRRFMEDFGDGELVFGIFEEGLVEAWIVLDKLVQGGDISFDQPKKDFQFLNDFHKILNNRMLHKHHFEGDVIIKVGDDGISRYQFSGVHSDKAFMDGTVRIKLDSEIEDLGNGFYKAKVEKQIDGLINDQGTNWKVKKDRSTFFPDIWSVEKIKAEITYAYSNRVLLKGNKYSGLTTGGIEIIMFLDEAGNIKTAFPNL